jgi:hypothetical protein
MTLRFDSTTPLGRPGGARGVKHHAGGCRRSAMARFPLFRTLFRSRNSSRAARPSILRYRAELMEPRMVVFPQPPRIEVDDMLDADARWSCTSITLSTCSWSPDHDETRAAMAQNIGHLFGDGVLVQRDRDRADLLRGDHRPIKRGAVAPDHRHSVAAFDPQHQKTRGHGANLGLGLGPAPALPDAEFLLAIGRTGAIGAGIPRQQRGDRNQVTCIGRTACQSRTLPCRRTARGGFVVRPA